MAQFHPSISQDDLLDKIVLLTGDSNGIGTDFAEICCRNGAFILIGDLDEERGKAVTSNLRQNYPQPRWTKNPRAVFHKTDVTDYQSVLDLFDAAFSIYGRIDHVMAAAGMVEIGDWFDPTLTLESVRKAPTRTVVDMNPLGCLYVARVASVYLRHNRNQIDHATNTDRSITLMSSVPGFKESPGQFVYQASNHGVLGLMRSLRRYISSPTYHNIRVNTVCPWVTNTSTDGTGPSTPIDQPATKERKISGIKRAAINAAKKSNAVVAVHDEETSSAEKSTRLSANTPLDVARVTAGMVCDPALNGKCLFVEGGRAWEVENQQERFEPRWLAD